MTKKEFERESYLAPEWGMRIIMVERHILDLTNEGGGGSYGEGDTNENGDY